MRLLARPSVVPLWIGLLLISLLISLGAFAGPVAHEHFEPDAAEDLRLLATTASGSMPAAVQTRSGLVAAPDEEHRMSQDPSAPYGGTRTPDSPDANYHIDRLTTRPERVKYDEPFRPSILPFKRLYAFDQLSEDFSFTVHDRSLTVVTVGGVADESEDVFFADLEVDLVPNIPVRIPSVGAGTRVRAVHIDPPGPISLVEDGAENWFVRAERGGRSRLVMHLSVKRATFGAPFSPVTASALLPYVPPLPERAKEAARRVADQIGIDADAPPEQLMINLVQYFRKFRESADLPKATTADALYEELSLSQKGVCRHRAYAFAITAQGLGLPTRLIHNEAHAWVEVFDSQIWHRIDLGGAASEIRDTNADLLLPNHRPPRDPYSWPRFATPGSSAARHTPASPGGSSADSFPPFSAPKDSQDRSASGTDPGPRAVSPRPLTGAQNPSASGSSQLEPRPELSLRVAQESLLRGHPLRLSGVAKKEGRACRFSRVDVYLDDGSERSAIGSLSTDEQGRFDGQVTVPLAARVGKSGVVVEVSGGCSP